MNKIFIDSNIVLYILDVDQHKSSIAQKILLSRPLISAQILTEVANVCKRRFKYSKEQVLSLWSDLLMDCVCVETGATTFFTGVALSKKYDFQVYDSLIVAAALNADCEVLYSEDMQHGMVIENKLTIVNPFV
ncbi:MAG: PIN domain-containing protein [Bacteroidetes bacterium]|nr:PIN domain-containing protein [Bacteroidota bacterium]